MNQDSNNFNSINSTNNQAYQPLNNNQPLSNNQPINSNEVINNNMMQPINNTPIVSSTPQVNNISNINQNNINYTSEVPVNNSNNINQPVINNIQNQNVIPTQPNNMSNINSQTKKTNTILFIIIGVVAFILIALAAFFGIKTLIGGKNNKDISPTDALLSSEVFFFKGKDSEGKVKYALIDKNGNNLTDFIYDKVSINSEIFNGASLVQKDDKYGIINSKGKEIVKLGEYEFISYRDGGLYQARDKNNKYHVINSKGKVVYTYKSISSLTIDLRSFDDSELFSYAVDGTKLILFNVDGKKLKEYEINKDANSIGLGKEYMDNYLGDADDLYSSIYYNGNLTIYDNSNYKVVFDGKLDYPYRLHYVAYDNKTFYLSPITYYGSDNGKDKKNIIIYKNKITEIDTSSVEYNNNYLIGTFKDDNDKYLINPDGSKGQKLYNGDLGTAYYIDNKNFALSTSSPNKKVEFYVNGKNVKTVEDIYINTAPKNDTYLVRVGKDNTSGLTWYNKNGERILSDNYKDLTSVDENERGIAKKSDSSKEILIDKSGKQKSKEYDDISSLYVTKDKPYYVIKDDSKYGLMDKDGKLIIKPKYTNSLSDYKIINDDTVVIGNINSDEAEVFSVKKGVLLKGKPSDLRLDKNYIIHSYSDNGTYHKDYYTYNGKKFYSE